MVKTITGLADLGFSMTVRDISELVQSYVEHSDHERGKKTFHYKGKQGNPGPDWVSSFIKNNKPPPLVQLDIMQPKTHL